MSILLRQVCATLVILVLINGSQAFYEGYPNTDEDSMVDNTWTDETQEAAKRFLRIGKSTESDEIPMTISNDGEGENVDEPANLVEVDKRDDLAKRVNSNIRIGKRAHGNTWIRIGRRDPYNSHIRIGRSGADRSIIRVGRADPATTPAKTWIRIGKREDSDEEEDERSTTFYRIGRDSAAEEEGFLRIGKAYQPPGKPGPLRLGRRSSFDKRYIRLGRSILNANRGDMGSPLTADELQTLRENKERLLQLLTQRPELINMNPEDLESFYFPRMGRSGSDTEVDESKFCCAEGVRTVVTDFGKGVFEICPREQSCCKDLNVRTKRYKDLIIVECAVSGTEAPPGLQTTSPGTTTA